jgi:ferritin-like metal-binding protein YciE
MPQRTREIFIIGLRNAHSMEVQARELMERQSERLADYPEVQARVRSHLEETNKQLQRLEECLEWLGEGTSSMKDTAQSVIGNVVAMSHALAGDEILKNTFANNAFENYEIAAYKSLLAMCKQAGAGNAQSLLQLSLTEEERMAEWLKQNVEKVTLEYLRKEERSAA